MKRIGFLFVMGLLVAGPVSAQGRRGVEERDAQLGATFRTTVNDSGKAVLTMTAHTLRLENVVGPTGESTLRLTQGTDAVSIESTRAGTVVTRDGRRITVSPQDGGLEAVHTLLSGSPAVRTFKRLVAQLEARDEKDATGKPAQMQALLFSGAVVQVLDGDEGAFRRLADRATRKAHARMEAVRRSTDCWGQYERDILASHDQYLMCLFTRWGLNVWWEWADGWFCETEYLLRSQSYWWQAISCSAVPF